MFSSPAKQSDSINELINRKYYSDFLKLNKIFNSEFIFEFENIKKKYVILSFLSNKLILNNLGFKKFG